MNLLRAASTVSLLTLASRITGLGRELLIAASFGASAYTDAFNVAFRIPNLLRRLFAEGAFSQAFVPILAATRASEGDEVTRRLIDAVGTVLFWALLLTCVVGTAAAPLLVWAMASGLEQFDAAVLMTRVMFPYIGFMSLVALAAGVLHTWKRFAVPAVTPVLLNIAVMLAAWLLAPWLQRHGIEPILALAVGVMVGGVLQLAVQWPALRAIGSWPRIGMSWSALKASLHHPGVARILRQMGPALLGVSVAQLSLLINTQIASHVGVGAVSWLTYADRLMEFPTALLGVALGVVLLPQLSAAQASGDAQTYSNHLDWGLRLVLLLALPSAVALLVFPQALVSVLYHYGQFNAHDVQQTVWALRGYGVGLLGLIAVKVLAPGFYAKQDIRTPRQDCRVGAGAHAIDEPAVRPAVRTRRSGAVDRRGRPGQCRLLVHRPAAARGLRARPRLVGFSVAGNGCDGRAGCRSRCGGLRNRLDRAGVSAAAARRIAHRQPARRRHAVFRRAVAAGYSRSRFRPPRVNSTPPGAPLYTRNMPGPYPFETPSALEYFASLVADDASLSLLEAAAAIAQDDHPGLDTGAVLSEVDSLADKLKRRIPADVVPLQRLRWLNRYFFQELGFAGNVNNYYDPRNSYLHEVLRNRRGIPITLAILYIELATQIGLRAHGVSFPGHFLVKLSLLSGSQNGEVVIDPFTGHSLSREELDDMLAPYRRSQGLVGEFEAPLGLFLQAAPPREILARMLRNLKEIHSSAEDWPRLLAVLNRLIVLLPQAHEERRDRGLAWAELGQSDKAAEDFEVYLRNRPQADDHPALSEQLERLRRGERPRLH